MSWVRTNLLGGRPPSKLDVDCPCMPSDPSRIGALFAVKIKAFFVIFIIISGISGLMSDDIFLICAAFIFQNAHYTAADFPETFPLAGSHYCDVPDYSRFHR
jgi:hypothetical protein